MNALGWSQITGRVWVSPEGDAIHINPVMEGLLIKFAALGSVVSQENPNE